jgi:hypothetical protein
MMNDGPGMKIRAFLHLREMHATLNARRRENFWLMLVDGRADMRAFVFSSNIF